MVKTSMVWQTVLESTTLLEANPQSCNNTVRVFNQYSTQLHHASTIADLYYLQMFAVEEPKP